MLCWDSLHRIIFEAGGLWSDEAYLRQRLVRKQRMPLDLRAHERRNGGTHWNSDSALLDWLGVSLHVSQMEVGGGRALLEQDNSLEGVDTAVHNWLTHSERLKKGRAPLARIVKHRPIRINGGQCAAVCVCRCAARRTCPERLNSSRLPAMLRAWCNVEISASSWRHTLTVGHSCSPTTAPEGALGQWRAVRTNDHGEPIQPSSSSIRAILTRCQLSILSYRLRLMSRSLMLQVGFQSHDAAR